MCKLLYFVQSLNYICSVVILTVISLERYLAINHPMLNKRFARTRTVRGAVATAVWLTSVLYSLPHLIAYDTTSVQRQTMSDLDDDVGGGGDGQTTAGSVVVDADVFCFNSRPIVTRVYIFVNFAALYVVPLSLMTFVYARISVVLWQSGSQSAAAAACSSCPLSTEARRTRTARGGSLRNPAYLRDASSAGTQGCQPTQRPICPSLPTPRRAAVHWTTPTFNRRQQTAIEVVAVDLNAPADNGEPQIRIVDERSPGRRDTDGPTAASAVFTQHNPLRSRRKVIRLLIAFVVSFAVCMLPNHVWLLWQQWADLQLYSYEQYARHMYVPPVMTLLVYVNSCLNPFLYALISDKFRSAVSEAECLRRCCRRRRADDVRCVAKSVPLAPMAPPGEESL